MRKTIGVEKFCHSCKKKSCFSKSKRTPDGLATQCKLCVLKYRKERDLKIRIAGLCQSHPKKQAVKGKSRCQECLDSMKTSRKIRYDTNKLKGRCTAHPGVNTPCLKCKVRNKKNIAKNLALGMCAGHPNVKTENGKTHCAKCLKNSAKSVERLRKIRTNSGFCSRHPKEQAVTKGRCPKCCLVSRLRCRLREVLKRKSKRTERLLGCSFQDFVLHIESQFADGMNWGNCQDWHIDHYIPIKAANEEPWKIEATFFYKNLRPIWKAENLTKSSKYDINEAMNFFASVQQIYGANFGRQ